MKSRSNHTAPSGRRLLIVNSVILLLVNCAILVQSEEQKNLIELYNWINVDKSTNSFPKTPAGNIDSGFLVYHSEYVNGPLFGLKKTFLDNIETITGPDLSFSYYSTGSGSFRSRKGQEAVKRDIKLTPAAGSWQKSPALTTPVVTGLRDDLKTISKDDWNNFAFISVDPFTIGLKDVSVKYIERVDVSKIGNDEITSFKDKPDVVNFALAEVPAVDASKTSFVFKGKSARFDLTALSYKTLTFTLKTDKDEEKVTVAETAITTTKFRNFIKASFDKTTKVIAVLNIDVEKDGFTISDITYDGTTKKPTEENLKKFLNPQFDADTKIYTLDQVTKGHRQGYVQLGETVQDTCYTVTKYEGPNAIIDVYLTLEGAAVGIKLATIKENTKQVCIRQSVALQNLGKYMVSYVVEGEVPANFRFSVKTTKDTNVQGELKVPSGKVENQWLFYNSYFDYTVTTPAIDVTNEVLVCDVVANCYPLETVDHQTFKISDEIKRELAKTPIVRVQSSNPTAVFFNTDTDAKFDKFYQKVTKTFDDKLEQANKESIKAASVTFPVAPAQKMKYELTFGKESKQASIAIPLDLVDFREQQLITKIQLFDVAAGKAVKPTDPTKISLVSLSYRKSSEVPTPITLPFSMFPSLKVEFDSFTIGTDELFVVEPAKVLTGSAASVVLKLDADYSKFKVLVDFEIKKSGRIDRVVRAGLLTEAETEHIQILSPNEAKPSTTNEFKLAAKKTVLLLTDWIASNSQSADLNSQFDIASTTAAIDPKKIQIYRVLVDQETIHIEDEANPTVNPNPADGKKQTFIEKNVKAEAKGPFRVGYIFHSSDDKTEATVKLTSLNVKGSVAKDSDDVCKKQFIVYFGDCIYEAPVCPSTFESASDKSCQMKHLNQLTEKRCDMSVGCENIFDRRLPVSTNTAPKRLVPFQIEPKVEGQKDDGSFHFVEFKRVDPKIKGDFCVKFNYVAKDVPLVVSTLGDLGSGISFPVTPKEKDDTFKPQSQKVCASWLTKDSVDSLYFRFDQKPLYDIDNHYVSELVEIPTNAEFVSTIAEGINYADAKLDVNTKESQFSQNDNNRWKQDGVNLKYTISNNDLRSLTPNTQSGTVQSYVSILRTKWIKVPNKDGHLRVGFAYDANKSDKNKLASINLRVLSSSFTQVSSSDISAVKPKEIFSVSQSTADNYYQLEISVRIANLSKIAELAKDAKWTNALELTLEKFTVNDPCVNDKNEFETCSLEEKQAPAKNVIHGTCKRTYANFTSSCNCSQNYDGNQCELFDYCKEDQAKAANKKNICKSIEKCHNDKDFGQVKCDCDEGQYWNPLNGPKCEVIKDLIHTCGANQVPKSKTACICADGFVNITNACVAFEPCNEEHRKAYKVNYIPPQPCKNADAKCKPLTGKNKPTDFECVCEKGVNVNGVRTEEAKCLPAECADCPNSLCQKDIKDNAYKCAAGCSEGFKEDKDKKCVIDPKYQNFINKFKCPGELELKEDKQPGCKCGHQKYDPTTRGCLRECSAELVAECTQRKAPTCGWVAPDPTKPDTVKLQCGCNESDYPYSTNETEPNQWTCVPKCDLLKLPENQALKCSGTYQHCNSAAKLVLDTTNKKVQNADLIANVFVVNASALLDNPDPVTGYCLCEVGFEKNGKNCEPTADPIHYIRGMEFDLKPSSNEKTFIGHVEIAFANLIKAILKFPKNKELIGTKCIKKDADTLSCSTSFETKLEDKDIRKKLADACVKVSDDKCVYVVPKPKPARRRRQAPFDDADILSHDTKKQKLDDTTLIETIDYCAIPTICSKYQFSTCQSDKAKGKAFECLCANSKYFDVSETTFFTSKNLQMQICSVKDLCTGAKPEYSCTDKTATCHFNVEHDRAKNEYKPISFCTCPATNLTLANQALSCSKTCNAKCGNVEDCAEDYLTGKVSCHCKDGWSGASCGTKVESETTSKAYLISTIVVSIIAVIALIGLAVLYFRRR